MPLSDVGLCARALLRVGARPILSFDDDTNEAEIAGALYAPLRDSLLSSYPWRSATVRQTLLPINPDTYADHVPAGVYRYALPNDFLRALSVHSNANGGGISYRLVGNTLEVESDTAVLVYLRELDASEMTPYIQQALMSLLSAEFCLSLTDDPARADFFYQQAERTIQTARQIDAFQDTPRALDDYPLITARG